MNFSGRGSITSLSQRRQGAQRPAVAAPRQQQQRVLTNGSSDVDTFADIQWLLSESETESELVAALDTRGFGTAPIIRSPLRGLRLTEGTDAILQCNIVGSPKPRVSLPDGCREIMAVSEREDGTVECERGTRTTCVFDHATPAAANTDLAYRLA
uniref:Ig-like domain-containing protein n=1 Tax=Parascaris equorum TaxID=6256 RepID=A0A914RQS6_PAREQ